MKSEFNDISIRGRVAYAIMCLENAIKWYKKDNLDWSFLFQLLWSFMKGNVADWHYPMAEATPRSILFDAEYSVKEMNYINREEYSKLTNLYNSSNEVIIFILNKLFEIGTRDLYSSISNNSLDTLEYLEDIIDIMNKNKIPLPEVKFFKKFSINENNGWGRELNRSDLMS
ncbi:hypothetical protein [Aquimarina aquimarini]|uniref:hypothetical protein n=1 Tax=Aquimarina aquimarini TaxID=1191734 RepID=UPI000D553E73|nr:hypothetical protein [Aquimarina aquimarini]